MTGRKADENLFAMRKNGFSARTVAKWRQSCGAIGIGQGVFTGIDICGSFWGTG
jgi:hypothetical protein